MIQDASKNIFRVLKFNTVIFAPLCVLTAGVLGVGMVTYPDFLLSTVGLPSIFFIILTAASYTLMLYGSIRFNETFTKETQLLLSANAIFFPLIWFLQYLLIQLESIHFPNYVFSTLHINIFVVQQIVLFSAFLLFLYLLQFSKKMLFSNSGTKKLSSQLPKLVMFYVVSVLFVSFRVFGTINLLLKPFVEIIRHPFYTFEQRKQKAFGGPYGVYTFINTHTPARTVIAVPPQNLWGVVGNIGFSRYFLYPRFLVHPENSNDANPVQYYVIASRYDESNKAGYDIWPKEEMKAKRIILFDEITREETVLDTKIFNPSDEIYRGKWGIIEVDL